MRICCDVQQIFVFFVHDQYELFTVNLHFKGNVRSGLPPLKPPPFWTEVNGKPVNFIDMCWDLGSSIILVPVIAVLGNVAIAKAFGNAHNVFNFIVIR